MNPVINYICLGVSTAIVVKGFQYGEPAIIAIGVAWLFLGVLALVVTRFKRNQ